MNNGRPDAAARNERPRRRRSTETIRGLVRETRLSPARLVLPLFICDGNGVNEPIGAIPGRARMSVDLTVRECVAAADLGVRSVCLFPKVPTERKTRDGREGLREDNLLARAIRAIKRELPETCVMTDVALDPYNSDGHDGIVGEMPGRTVASRSVILNDETVAALAKMSVLHAQAGADVVAPSDMMDGRVGAIRSALDGAGYTDTLILSYTAKYASAFYGPFREALSSAPVQDARVPRDKKTYQMDPANAREALVEARLDEAEGADMLMVKPALLYLDVIAKLRGASSLPIAAYHVSGEYAMVKAAAQRGWLDERAALCESLTAIARAGADIIFTYGALDWARWHRDGLAE
jgi:porphobilinogen synthase